MFDIITFGSASQDILVKPKHLTLLKYGKSSQQQEVCFPFGSKIDVDDIQFNSGGGGTNTAVTFAMQGFKTAFCGTVGTDTAGKEIIGELKTLKINTSLVKVTNKKPTNHSIVISGDASDRTILAYRGAAELMAKKDIPWAQLKTTWLYLAPLTGLLCDNFVDIVEFAFRHKIKIAVNPSIAQLSLEGFPKIARCIDILIMNQEEASFLTKIPYENGKEMLMKINVMSFGEATTVITKGGDGVMVSDGKYVYSALPLADRKIVDTTGAGDSFASGFLSAYMREPFGPAQGGHGDIEQAIQLGMANSAGCLSEVGAKNGLLKKGQGFEKVEVKKEEVL